MSKENATTTAALYVGASPSLPLGSLAPGGPFGQYHPDGRVTFAARPAREWEFMATGTGVTGLTVYFPDEMVMQVNHSAAIDEAGKLRALGRIHLDLDGRPFANAAAFRMEHDLRRSVIRAIAETPDGPVRVEIRAHVPCDVIRVDIEDGRKTPGALTLRLEEDAPSKDEYTPESGLRLWHENPTAGPDVEEAMPSALEGAVFRGLSGRAFGLAIRCESAAVRIAERTVTLPANPRHSLSIAGISTLGGGNAFAETARTRLAKARDDGAGAFVASHEAWWREFWARASFEPEDPAGVVLRHKAAFDLYRYFLACCAGEHRETPVRFQIDLFRYHLRQHDWLALMLCAVEQYQSYYGALRTGDWGALRNLGAFYVHNLPQYRDYARRVYGCGGARIPMGSRAPALRAAPPASPASTPAGVAKVAYNGENPAGTFWVLALLCDLVDLAGDDGLASETLLPLATDLVEFVRQRYPGRENRRMVIAPCNAGETWQGVRDPAEMVCALRTALPRLIAVGRTAGWPAELIAGWEALLAAVPEIPRGRLEYRNAETLPVIVPADRLAPAADMSACEAYVLPWSQGKPHYQLNAQQTELHAIWPAKLVLRTPAERETALASYRERLWTDMRDGWNLDSTFAACLGLWDDARREYAAHFDHTFTLPCGLARETAPSNPTTKTDIGNWIPESPSLQGLGTGILTVLEMLLQDYPDKLIVLPCWPADVPVSFALYSPYAGRVEVSYRPGQELSVKTERPLPVESPLKRGTP